MAAQIGWSMTIIERNDMLHLAQQEDLVWKFKMLGQVEIIDAGAFDAASMLAGVKEGIKRADALELAAHAVLGMAEMFRTGVPPVNFRECFVAGGSTVTG
ncbi:hypothetical protein PENARI_c007G02611 [Penicillium arizonense]|uniref:Pyrroline-5-carboxylate reductase dimerisation domain-containing protein n=1 Tax=Penicillium arizonense TaxID=1835702 RepID=A0A1F5LK24_PENAI|nr:hypothetical protein PENARI_c007G02611 [Penicillium arizonense]OGE53544.1 hypothetical protein PENARI_c007G02611 [Penicillium arizonense]